MRKIDLMSKGLFARSISIGHFFTFFDKYYKFSMYSEITFKERI